MKKIKNILVRNIVFKLLALILAIVLWLIVVNVEDPEYRKVYTVPVTVTNADYFKKKNKTFRFIHGSASVSFAVLAKRSVIENLTEGDFTALADLSKVNADETEVPVHIRAKAYGNKITIKRPNQDLDIKVEKIESKTFDIEVNSIGTPASGTEVAKITTDPKTVTVKGPKSVIEKVQSASVNIDLSGMQSSDKKTNQINLLDKNGSLITSDELTLSKESAMIKVSLQTTKTVKVLYKTTGSPASGYVVSKVKGAVSSVSVVGDTDKLQDL